MSLTILIKSASNLPNLESMGTSDPYVTVSFQGQKQKTEVQKSTLDPVWNAEIHFDVIKRPRKEEAIEVTVKDYERIGWNKLIGKTDVPFRNVSFGKTASKTDLEQTLLDENDQPTPAKLNMSVTYEPPSQASSVSFVDEVEGKKGGMPPLSGDQLASKNRGSLPKVKTKFQIRVRVVEARQLLGEELRPLCRVCFRQKIHQTKIQRSSSPWFDQIFFFHEESMPDKLMSSFLDFKVCNSRMLRSESVIGTFKCELGQVYDYQDHSIINRWLVLVHPDEPTPTVQGYLKVSVAVLGPGDVCPDMTASINDEDDIESNLLWSAGVHLQPATFTLSVYLAQNLPRMDSGAMQSLKEAFGFGKASKELVDPYVIASFAGREVQTRILYCNDTPVFKQQVHLGFLFPSMCNTFKITLMDWDRIGDDDVIGSAVVPIDEISAPGDNGFLPTFGPTFVNVYGARREWELWEGKEVGKMNVGAKEGCSYRGRVLVSLETEVGTYPSGPTTDIDEDSFNAVRRLRGTSEFVVVAHLTHAFLLKEANKPLEIEVSMGNFGNKLEDSLLPSPSSTHPSNPVFDGCKYYYLPWGDSVPLIMIQCEWEDISQRLMASNAILHIADDLEDDLNRIKTAIKGKTTSLPLILVQMKEILGQLKNSCRSQLPQPDPTRFVETSLDTLLRRFRQQELESFCQTVDKLLNKSLSEMIDEGEIILARLRNLAKEPQSSMPDIFLWLLSGTERLAYARIPAQSVLHSNNPRWCGLNSGKFDSILLKYPGTSTGSGIGGMVRASIWLGRAEDLSSWWEARPDLQLTVYAETYENQVVSTPGSGKWTNKGALMRRPAFSDADGLMSLPKEQFKPSPGWKFQGNWVIDPDPSIKFSLDAGHTIYCEEVFQQQARVPGGTWLDIPQATWADARGDPERPRDDFECPQGWEWRDAWTTDLQRAVDSEGWEYTVQKGITGWSPQEKLYHVLRRRRWIRERHRVMQAKVEEKSKDGWEYSTLFSKRYHARERAIDIVRRRRWRRKLVPSSQGVPETPRIMVASPEDDTEKKILNICPRQYVMSSETHQYQLRAHIFQARDLASGDKSGLSDPFAIVSFCGVTQQTEKIPNTLSPTWDQTLIFETKITGPLLPPNDVCRPPAALVELYDWDARGDPDYLGRITCDVVISDPSEGYKPPKLKWYQVEKGNGTEGDLLGAFELLLMESDSLPVAPPTRGDLLMVPFGIRPLLQRTRIEILCWGVRNMSTYELQSVTRPCIEFECGGNGVKSTVMKNIRFNPNFDKPHLTFDVELPKEELYMPPLSIRVNDHRSFGARPLVATATITDLHHYNVEPIKARKISAITQTLTIIKKINKSKKPAIDRIEEETCHDISFPEERIMNFELEDNTIDWWAKYYASTNDEGRCGSYLSKGYEKLEVIKGNLEDDSRYNSFRDLIDTIPLYRGRLEQSTVVGEFKGTFRIYSIPPSGEEPPMVLQGFPSPDPHEVIARVYVISARDLAPKDSGNSSDPYVVVALGKQTQRGEDEYKVGTLNPTFGKVFEVKATIPLVKDLKVQVWDRDKLSSDDLIGETVIDLENRFLSRYRAHVGLPKQYHVVGPNAWRDHKLPSEILEESARIKHMDGPHWDQDGSSLRIDGVTYSLSEYEPEGTTLPPSVGEATERLALHVLNACFSLVAEHVEERPLFNSERPGLPQGTISLWVDLFPSSIALPPMVDITPRRPTKYILRVCVFNVYEFPLDETSITGEQMSDVYVKGWLEGTSNVQKTDIHYRCMEGEANFNWRFVFPFDYLEAEQMIVVTRKISFFSSDEVEERRPPKIVLQLWDDDLLLKDDFLGEMTLNLCSMVKPAKTLNKASMNIHSLTRKLSTTAGLSKKADGQRKVNLFESKRVYGYFPFVRVGPDGLYEEAGKLEAEFEVLSEKEAETKPAGEGRNSPNSNPSLAEPKRPSTSFLWITSPWKSFKFVIWKKFKWHFVTFVFLFLLLLFIFLFLYALPGAAMDYIIGVD